MRLWSISPSYLDQKGLCGLWREGLLAQKVLLEQTKGYKNHPQLERFNIQTLQQYLHYICDEGINRHYNFDRNLIKEKRRLNYRLTVTIGQLQYEFEHLQSKLDIRNPKWRENCCHKHLQTDKEIKPHPLFKVVEGEIELWEKISDKNKTKQNR